MTRRELLLGALAGPGGLRDAVLVHEHILVDFIGADKVSRDRYNADDVFRSAAPKLKVLKATGCVRMLECTPNYLGRDPRLLRRLSDSVGVDIWTNTGLYGAADHKYVPSFALEETAEQIAKRWIDEAEKGVEGLKPKFIKTGVNEAPLDPLDRKLIAAAALTSKETGLTIASHTGGRGPAAIQQLDIVERMGVSPEKFVWVHAQNEKNHSFHEKIAAAGAWVEFDGVNESSAAWHLECVSWMNDNGLIDRTLISQDSGWWHVGEPNGGVFKGYAWLFTDFLPLLPESLWPVLLVANPRRAFGA